jgi:GPH family glycoside/pentoside/hexuronide:cation symporter
MEEQLEIPQEIVPLKSRIAIAGADSAGAILQALVAASALTYYFTEIRGLSMQLTGIVWLLFGIWNAINDPLFGWISDRTKSRLGRRLPYIRYGAPFFVLGFILFWVEIPGTQATQRALFMQMLLALFVFDAFYTAIATCLWIMPYEVAISNQARSSIYLWKIIFMVFTVAVPLVLERTIKPEPGDLEGINLFRIIMFILGIAMGMVIFFSTFFYREKRFTQAEEQFAFFKSLKDCFTNRAFVVFEVLSFTAIFAQTALMQGLWIYFDKIAVSPAPLYLALAVGIVVGAALWINRRDVWGIKVSVRWMSLMFATGCFLVLLFGRTTPTAALGFFLFGIGFAGGMYLIPLMNGDVVDMDEHQTGLRREGMYAGVNSFVTKPAISIAQWVRLTILGAFGYVPGLPKGIQSAQVETGILVAWVLPTGVLLLLSFFVLRWYPLAGHRWEKIKERLAIVHSEKERRYLQEQSSTEVELALFTQLLEALDASPGDSSGEIQMENT